MRRCFGLLCLTAACSGGEKIITGGAGGGTIPARWVAEDSAYLANLVANQAISTFKNLRTLQAADAAAQVVGTLPNGCRPAVSSTADANGNGIVDDQTLTFSAANCTISQGSSSSRITGTIRIQDTGLLRGYRVSYGSLQQAGTIADTTISVEINGTLEVQYASATSGRSTNNTVNRFVRQQPGGSATLSLTAATTGAYSPNTGQIVPGRNIPAGSYTLTGTVGTTLSASGTLRAAGQPASATFTVAISTALAMTYDGSCTADRAFGAGQLRGAASGYATGTIATGFTGCGQGVTPPPGVKR
jgi:hypothetical protein